MLHRRALIYKPPVSIYSPNHPVRLAYLRQLYEHAPVDTQRDIDRALSIGLTEALAAASDRPAEQRVTGHAQIFDDFKQLGWELHLLHSLGWSNFDDLDLLLEHFALNRPDIECLAVSNTLDRS